MNKNNECNSIWPCISILIVSPLVYQWFPKFTFQSVLTDSQSYLDFNLQPSSLIVNTLLLFLYPLAKQELQDKNDELQMEIEQLRLQLQRHENRRRNRRRRTSSDEESDDLINYEPNSLQLNHLLFVSWEQQLNKSCE